MATDRFDQTARFTARFDPEGFLAWLFPGFAEHLRFERWLDTRTAPMPGMANQTADTVGELFALHNVEPPWLLLLEFQTETDPEMFGRLLEQLGKFWREHRPDALPGSRYQLVAAVVNLTGTLESLPASRQFTFPIRKRGLGLAVEERHLATESAADTLDAIARAETAKSILSFIPLMTGGGEEGIIQRWLEIAGAVPDHRRRGELGSLALTMADLKPWCAEWQKALKEWNMRESTFVQGWINVGIGEGRDKGRDEGRLLALRHTLRTLLTKRFGPVSADVLTRIEATTDPETLDRAFNLAFDIASPEDLPL
jgi:hypothetical protein